MKRSFFTILIITISIALFSVCIVTAADADNIDLGDSDFESGFLLVDYSVESNQQELGNKPVDIRGYNNRVDTPAYSIEAAETKKAAEEILSQYMHKDSGLKSDSGLLFMDYSIESSQGSAQELGNKPVDMTKYDDKYIQNMEDKPIHGDDLRKQAEEILRQYMHNSTKDSDLKSDSGLLHSDAMNKTSDDNISNIFINEKPCAKDSGFESGFLLMDNSIQSSTQGNKYFDITKYLDEPIIINYDDLCKQAEEILRQYMHNSTKDSDLKSDSGL